MSAWFLNIISEFLKNHFFTGNQFSWGKTSIAGVILAAVLLLLRKIWKKLEPRFVNWVSQSILNIVHSISPGFYRRYRKKIIMSHDSFNVKGLGLIASYSLNLTDVFVELKISASKNPQETAKHFLDTQDSKNARDIWDFIRITEKKDTKRKSYAIIGAPGSGKTTLLQNVAITLLNNRHKRHKIRRYTPTLLFLRDYADKIKNDNPPLSELLDKHFSDKKLFPTLKPPPKWFENKLIRGKCIVLLDGLDEVGDLDKRKAVSAWVDNQINNYPDCLFIITSRPLGYLKAPLTNINVLELCNFTAGQVRSFISKWYLENEIKSAGNVNNEKVKELAKTWTEYLLQGLRQIPALIELTVNPLLLTMIAMVHKFHGKLPGSRYELYKEMCEVMLGRWRQTKGIEEEFSAGKKRFILVPLACHMMKNKLREIPINDAVTLLRQDLKKIGVKDKEEENFFKNLHETSGILIEKETGILSFAHLTFQEYLTASCLPKNSDWAQLITDSWWHETIRLYCAQGDATEIIKSCLNEKSISSLLFALECAEEAERVNADIRQELNDIIFNNLESDDKKLFKVAAEVILNKRLKSFTKIDETREISTSFITCAEYQLFIDDMKKDGIYIKPDHWLDDKFPTGIANMELTGITLTDSLRFCKWLTDKSNGIFFYRLLTEKEAEK
ncbi:MAG: NACHT domain-containing protein [Nitrospirae bacterium]|nr:NACHT domain-containing protein [Nitrospirota bacterium]